MLPAIITALRDRCPTFGGRVAGAAEFGAVTADANMTVPAAYVVPQDDRPAAATTATGYRQELADAFSVVVAISNIPDRRGQAAVDAVRILRRELWRGIVGWEPDAEHGAIVYDGGQVLDMTRQALWYRFDFEAPTTIDGSDTWSGQVVEALPAIEAIEITLDAIDPADPNVAMPGPDGRAEGGATIVIPQDQE